LVPTLDSRCNRVQDDGEVKHPREFEAVGDLLSNGRTVVLVELLYLLEQRRRLGKERALDKERLYILEAVLVGEVAHIGKQLMLRNASKRVTDLALEIGCQPRNVRLLLSARARHEVCGLPTTNLLVR
jgi:hypothetical protein